MKISAAESALLSTRERDMLKSNGPWNVKDLVSLIKRIRDLRDKQRQLTQRQKIASARRTGSKSGTSGAANARTAEKGRLFDRALSHYEGELDKLNTESSSAAASLKVGGAKKSTAVKPAKKAGKAAKKTTKKAAKSATESAARSAKKSSKKSTAKKPAAKKSAAKKTAAKKTAVKKATAKKATAKKKAATKKTTAKKTSGKAAKKSTAKKGATSKAAAKKAPAKKAPAKEAPAKKSAKKSAKQVSRKRAARKVAKAAEARRHAAPKGPVQNVSDKARLNLPKGPGGHVDSQITSLPSHNKRSMRSR